MRDEGYKMWRRSVAGIKMSCGAVDPIPRSDHPIALSMRPRWKSVEQAMLATVALVCGWTRRSCEGACCAFRSSLIAARAPQESG
jgi:hypothetical protein